MLLQCQAVCRQKGSFPPLRNRAKIWYSVNRHQSRKAIETTSVPPSPACSCCVSTDIKAERQMCRRAGRPVVGPYRRGGTIVGRGGDRVGGDHRAPRLSSMRISADISFGLSAPEYAIIYASSRDVGMPPEADRGRQRERLLEREKINDHATRHEGWMCHAAAVGVDGRVDTGP